MMRARRSSGFTLVEVLATLLLIGVLLPAIMRAITMGTQTSSYAHHATDAADLIQSKLDEIVATSQWQNGNLAGDFSDVGPEFQNYHWSATVQPWSNPNVTNAAATGGIVQQLDLTVNWRTGNSDHSMSVSTLVYGNDNPPAGPQSGAPVGSTAIPGPQRFASAAGGGS